jgi:hypothetical protein
MLRRLLVVSCWPRARERVVAPCLDFIFLPLLLVLVFVVPMYKVTSRNNLEPSEDHRVTSIALMATVKVESQGQGGTKVGGVSRRKAGVERRRTEAIADIILLSLSGQTCEQELLVPQSPSVVAESRGAGT